MQTPTRSRLGRILIIEDNGDATRTVTEFLTLEGHTVTLARSAAAGTATALAEQFDVIICDLGLGGGDAVALHLRRAGRPVPYLIAVTRHGAVENRLRAIEAGFDHHLVTPIAIHLLLNAIALGVGV